MRVFIFLLASIFLTGHLIAQQPSMQDIQGQMKEMVKELNKQIADLEKQIAEAKKNKEDPESVKDMEDHVAMLRKQVEQMGAVSKGISKIPDNVIKTVNSKGENKDGIPTRDIDRIKTIPDRILSDAELLVFIRNMQEEVEKKILPEQLQQAKYIYKTAAEKKYSDKLGMLASLCWMNNFTELALYFAGKSCLDNIKSQDHLNNYAAFLSMTGGEHLALPILQNLDQKYPGNSTVLNNIAQAWFGLGEIATAKQYIDKTQAVFPGHRQAQRTKCLIQQSEGQIQESTRSMEEYIKEGYDADMEAELEKQGGKLKYEDVPFKYPVKAEPLGIERFLQSIPEYPFEGGERASLSWMEWYDFKQKVMAEREAIEKRIEQLKIPAEAHWKQLGNNPLLLMPFNNKIHLTAKRKQQLLGEWGLDRIQRHESRMKEAGDSIGKWKIELEEALERLTDCGARKSAATTFLTKANGLYKQLNDQYKIFLKQWLNDQANLSMYTSTDQSVHSLTVETIKLGVMLYLYGIHCFFDVGCVSSDGPQAQPRRLPDFDDVNCQYKTELSIPYMEKTFSIKVECNRMTTKFDLPFIKAEIQERLNTNRNIDIVKGSVEISTGFSKDIPLKGPLSAEMELKVGAFVEISNNRVSEVGITGELSATVKTQNLDKSIQMEDGSKFSVPKVNEQKLEIGTEVRSSWNTETGNLSTSVSGKGLFEGSRVSFK